MFVTWDPEDGSDKTTFDFDPDDVLASEAVEVEKQYGEAWEMWLNGLRTKEAKARRILLWWHLKQTHKRLQFKDAPDFRMRQLTVEMNSTELADLKTRIEKAQLDEDTKERTLRAIDLEMREAMEREGIYEGDIVEGTVALPKTP